jgi:hypothetical protein
VRHELGGPAAPQRPGEAHWPDPAGRARGRAVTRRADAGDTRAERPGRGTAVAGVGTVAVSAAVISYSHVMELARRAGETRMATWLLPLSIDGAIAAAVAVILAASRAGRRPRGLTWLLLALGLAASLAANIASAHPTVTARAVAAWPPLALAVGVEVLAELARRTSTSPSRDGQSDLQRVRTGPVRTSPATAKQSEQSDLQPVRTRPVRTGPDGVGQASGDDAAVARIRELDQVAGRPVSRQTIRAELSCGASRADRLAGLARAGHRLAVAANS